MNIRNILTLYRIVSITEINESNKRILVQQHLHSKKMDEMNENLRYGNRLQGQILDNQINEIKHTEILKYYKNLAYSMKDVLKTIEKQSNPNFKKFLIDLFGNAISLNLISAKKNLEEISDKSFCDEILDLEESTLLSATDNAPDYKKSSFYALLHQEKEQERLKEIAVKKKEQYTQQLAVEQEKVKEKESKIGGLFILGGLTGFFFIATILAIFDSAFDAVPGGLIMTIGCGIPFYIKYKKEFKDKGKSLFDNSQSDRKESDSLKEEYEHAELEANKCDLSNEIAAIEDEVCNWENVITTIHGMFPEPCEEKQEVCDLRHRDPFFEEAARLVVGAGQGSTSMLQRKFSIGYNRSTQLMNQLEVAGIVGPQIGNDKREVYINDLDTLEMILQNIHANYV